ncbi:MAG: hypothetical protein FWF52_02515 [Candidatus Azobacteroides sp.]|nr:hypothetical protein [Candidatus Azobacteroides sp.]
MKKKRSFLVGIIFSCLFFSCNEAPRSSIPNLPVDITLNLDFQDKDLLSLLATESITKPRLAVERIGFGGVLVINGGYGIDGQLMLFAYDLACPVEANEKITVIADNAGKAKCPVCGAVYNLISGSGNPESGSKYPLKTYSVFSVSGIGKQYRILN